MYSAQNQGWKLIGQLFKSVLGDVKNQCYGYCVSTKFNMVSIQKFHYEHMNVQL